MGKRLHEDSPEGETRDEKSERKRLKRERKLAKKLAKLNGASSSATTTGESTPATTATDSNAASTPLSNGPDDAITSTEIARDERDATSEFQTSNGRYEQHHSLSALPETQIQEHLANQKIHISQPKAAKHAALRPILGFYHLPVDALAFASQTLKTFPSPTPIQSAAWPYLLSGRDVVGIAQTGSGKTLAFGIPCVRHVHSLISSSTSHPNSKSKSKKHGVSASIRAVIVSPTRELALQIHAQISTLTESTSAPKLQTVAIYGGVPKEAQRAQLAAGAHILVATPGRLNDFIADGAADLSGVEYLVLDEADRMLDKGFEDDVKRIVASVTSARARVSIGGKCQMAMFTATWPASIRALAATYLVDPIRITVGGDTVLPGDDSDDNEGELRANTSISQDVRVVLPEEKETQLLDLLRQHLTANTASHSKKTGKDTTRVLVFCLYKKEAARIATTLTRRLPNGQQLVTALHGDMAQAARSESLGLFRSGERRVLVATDVAARGLDIPAVALVVNYTFPLTVEDYVHRIGRTGRAGRSGQSVTFFTEHEKGLAGGLSNVLKASGQRVPDELRKFGGTVVSKKRQVMAEGGFSMHDLQDENRPKKIVFD